MCVRRVRLVRLLRRRLFLCLLLMMLLLLLCLRRLCLCSFPRVVLRRLLRLRGLLLIRRLSSSSSAGSYSSVYKSYAASCYAAYSSSYVS